MWLVNSFCLQIPALAFVALIELSCKLQLGGKSQMVNKARIRQNLAEAWGHVVLIVSFILVSSSISSQSKWEKNKGVSETAQWERVGETTFSNTLETVLIVPHLEEDISPIDGHGGN